MMRCRYGFGMWLLNQECCDFAVKAGVFAEDDNFDGYDLQAATDGTYLDGSDESYGEIKLRDYDMGYEDEAMIFDALLQPDPASGTVGYQNQAEVIQEFRSRYGRFLPEDFDYAAHIGIYQYCFADE